MNVSIAIQGFDGSFHQEAARKFFGKEVNCIGCSTFREVLQLAADTHSSDGGLMAIENSIAGSILPNYNLLKKSHLKIIGEVYLQIRQNLLVNPGVTLEDIREVHSHPMALQQCFGFLDPFRWKLVETEDTALSAKQLKQHKSRHIAAIASKLAAEIYGLQILKPDIHTLKNNYTRFLVLKPENDVEEIPEADKASVNFSTDHSRGSLARVLTTIADGGINLSKLQSFPIPGSHFSYSFHADLEFDHLQQFQAVLDKIRKLTADFKIYGVSKNAKK